VLPTPSRESIMQAFLALVTARMAQNGYPYLPVKRGMVLASQLGDIEQPALFLREFDENMKQQGRGLPGIRTFTIFMIAYDKRPENVPGATVANPLLDAMEGALFPDNTLVDTVTLNVAGVPLAYQCQIDGTIVKETGDTDPNGQILIIVPVKLISS